MRRIPEEAFLSTARIFGTVGCPFWYRILQMPEKRRALPAPNATKPERGKALLVPNATNARKGKGIAGTECHKRQKRGAPIAQSAVQNTSAGKKSQPGMPPRARKSQPKAPLYPAPTSVPCDSVSISPKHLPKVPQCLPEASQHLPKAPQHLSEVLRRPAPASAPQPLPETMCQPRPPASVSTLCVTKCHYLSFGKCFDITEACRQR